ncbi:UNVERIFIED_CONTAM: hypothetical protein PYX00_006918 [Menopon gallinae]|uniref:Retinol dehydrogenase 14 n=1 Tax=Menopon gallinae TaxID=328185 RepID=A0AAW2HH72_9NEOP
MGHFLLTNLLLDLLVQSAPSRIINVTAATHTRGKINKEDLNSDKQYSELDAYNQSKLANILFTMELSERLKDKGVTVNAVNPGSALTGLYRKHDSSIGRGIGDFLTKPFMWIFFKSPQGGAQTTLYAALDPALEKVTGKYFEDCKEKEIVPHAKDGATAKWLWAVSEKWTRLSYHRKFLFSDEEPKHDPNDEGNVVIT